MKQGDANSKLDAFLRNFGKGQQPLEPIISLAPIFYRLAKMEEEATGYYEGIAEYSDVPWVCEFASWFANQERQHRQRFLKQASAIETEAMEDRITEPLSPEIIQLLSYNITPKRTSAEKTAVYLEEKDAVEFAILAECNSIKLLGELIRHIPEKQQNVLKQVLYEEMNHKATLEEILKKYFSSTH